MWEFYSLGFDYNPNYPVMLQSNMNALRAKAISTNYAQTFTKDCEMCVIEIRRDSVFVHI